MARTSVPVHPRRRAPTGLLLAVDHRARAVGTLIALVLSTGITVVTVEAVQGDAARDPITATAPLPTGPVSDPAWALDPNQAEAIVRAGLSASTTEGADRHIHASLAVTVSGIPVTVPEGIGMVTTPSGNVTGLSALHTHDRSGRLHVEAANAADEFDLGQVFTQWGPRVSTGCIGTVCNGPTGEWGAYVNGQRVGGNNPLVFVHEIVLNEGQQIQVVFGRRSVAPKDVFVPPISI